MTDFWFPDQAWKLIFDFLSLQESAVAAQVCKKWRSLVWSVITEVSVPNKFNNEDKFKNSTLVWLTQNCPNLRVLDLSGIIGLTNEGLTSVGTLKNLRQISVHRCSFNSDVTFAEALATLDNLQTLNFCRSGINDDFFSVLVKNNASLPRTLTELDISWTSVTRNSYPFLLGLTSLRNLKLNGLFSVDQHWVDELAKNLTRLVNLELRFNANDNLVIPKRQTGQQLQVSLANKDHITRLSQLLRSGDPAQELEGAIGFRKILSIERSPPIQESIDAGAVPGLIQLLQSKDPFVLLEACWALTNIASGTSTHTRIVVESGGVPISLRLARSRDIEVVTQAIWFVGNIAGDSYQMRDFVLSHDALPIILEIITGVAQTNISLLRNAVWTLSNLTRGKPQPEFETVKPCIPTLANLIYSTDDEVLTDALWALSYLSDGPNERIQAVLEAGVARRLVDLLLHSSFSVQTPALRTIGNIVTGDDLQTQILLNCSLLPAVNTLLSSPKKAIQKEACWTISNITAGNRTQIQAVVDSGVFPILSNKLANAEFDVKKEAAWAIANATSGGSSEQIDYLVNLGVIQSFCDILKAADPRIVMVSLEALDNILREGSRKNPEDNPYSGAIEDCGGLDLIEGLQGHQNNEIYEKCIHILENYFAAAEEDACEATDVNMVEGGANPF